MIFNKGRVVFAEPDDEEDDEDCGDFGC